MAKPIDLSDYTLEELNELIGATTKARDEKIEVRRAELMAELRKLDDVSKPSKGPAASRSRASPKSLYRAPSGAEWSGRGGIPRVFRDLGVTDKAGMEKYKIAV